MANNSVKQYVNYIKANPGWYTENELNSIIFGFERKSRNGCMNANKKYAEMLRRGLRKGLIIRRLVAGKTNRFEYSIPTATPCQPWFLTKRLKDFLDKQQFTEGELLDKLYIASKVLDFSEKTQQKISVQGSLELARMYANQKLNQKPVEKPVSQRERLLAAMKQLKQKEFKTNSVSINELDESETSMCDTLIININIFA